MKKVFLPVLLFISINLSAQTKKPLDHSVYDGWKTIGERMISNDGKFIVYAVNPQEGDGELVIQNVSTQYKKVIARGYNAVITEDSRDSGCPAKRDVRPVRASGRARSGTGS